MRAEAAGEERAWDDVRAPGALRRRDSKHAVQFYEDERFLVESVAQYLASGIGSGDALIVFASAQHSAAFLDRLSALGVPAERAIAAGQLHMLDAQATLDGIMVGDLPDAERFGRMFEGLLPPLRAALPEGRIRAYGEMVDVLWRGGNQRAALRLEELWNALGAKHEFTLLCAYSLRNLENERERFAELCAHHDSVLPAETYVELRDSDERLREVARLQQRAVMLEREIEQRKQLEQSLMDALRERTRVEEQLRDALEREHQARTRAEASDAFKEMFLRMLGHDLRNPLMAILTTARVMAMLPGLGPEHEKRLIRLQASGLRMQRMIEQILDVTRIGLSPATALAQPQDGCDLVAIVSRLAEAAQAAHPERALSLDAPQPCAARVDPERMEQVVRNLLDNAIAHGDPEQPISLSVQQHGGAICVSVHNFGPPIEGALLPLLFEPFQRKIKAQRSPDGLGLGLYISKHIVHAHGGQLEVTSSAQSGTRFLVRLPVHG